MSGHPVYALLKRLMFLADAETAHDRVLALLESLGRNRPGILLLRSMAGKIADRPVKSMGLTFRHPLGLAAGFDKNARAIPALQALGFSFVEIGTVTPRPQAGNPKPRIWRFPEANALVNALGFPGEGAAVVAQRLARLREQDRIRIPIGVNVGKNADTPAERAGEDFLHAVMRFGDLGDYYVINVSSPNTPGLRDLQAVDRLREVVEPVRNHLSRSSNRPLLVKISPDLADEDIHRIGELAVELELAGVIAANTTVRRNLVAAAVSLDRGGLSGGPLFPRTLQLIRALRSVVRSPQAIIAAGGISAGVQVAECLAAGASLVQVYTAFIYGGPRLSESMLADS